jgi:hypothetical protein
VAASECIQVVSRLADAAAGNTGNCVDQVVVSVGWVVDTDPAAARRAPLKRAQLHERCDLICPDLPSVL